MFFFQKKEIPLADFFPKGFIDIHSHLLPGIDDGAKDLGDSIDMLKKMTSQGIRNFITTPHILGNVYPNTPEIINKKLQLVKDELVIQNINNINIHAAAEYMMDEQFSLLLDNNAPLLTLKDNYILVEMSYFSPPINLYDILFQLQLKGYKPILAHPERYFTYHNNTKEFQKLKRAGCLFQLNFLSLTGQYGKPVQKITNLLLKQNMYNFLGTDVHSMQHLDLLKKIATKNNKTQLERLFQNNIRTFGN